MNIKAFSRPALCLAAFLASPSAQAQEPLGQRISVELNAAQDQGQGCKLSFLVQNGHGADIDSAVFETVIFDDAGQVSRLTLFDFGALPSGRPRVRQFVVPDTACSGIGQLLFNGAETCEGEGLAAGACVRDLLLETRTGIEVAG